MPQRLLWKEVFKDVGVENLQFVADGDELMSYFGQDHAPPQPHSHLVIIYLGPPKRTGISLRVQLKRTRHLRHVPVIVVGESTDEKEIRAIYDLGATS